MRFSKTLSMSERLSLFCKSRFATSYPKRMQRAIIHSCGKDQKRLILYAVMVKPPDLPANLDV